jgi:hypothetical protein
VGAAHDHTGGAVRESVDMIIVRDKIKKEDLLQNAEVIFEDDMIKGDRRSRSSGHSGRCCL